MQNSSISEARRSLLICLLVLGALAALILVPSRFGSETVSAQDDKRVTRRGDTVDGRPKMYDIREDKAGVQALAAYRQRAGKTAAAAADARDNFAHAEENLRKQIPHAKVEYTTSMRTPEIITPDVAQADFAYLSAPSRGKRSEILRGFLKEHNNLIGVTDAQADSLKVAADYTNPDGNLSFAHLEQTINGIPVFRGEAKAAFTKDGQILRIVNNLAPGLEYASLPTDFGDPAEAVRIAAAHIDYQPNPSDVARNDGTSSDLKAVFGEGDWATTAEKMYFPIDFGMAVPAWRVLLWQNPAYYVIVDAETGTVLWHKNLSSHQTQPVTYQVYRNPNAYIDVADSPAPLSPGPVNPVLGTQGALINRTNLTFIGNEGSLSFNNNGWITDNMNTTEGNAVRAGVDRDSTNGIDAPQTGNPNRVFDSTWNPPPGNPPPGDDPLLPQAQRGAVIQMFYIMNRYHDEMYKLGFTEASRNFQLDNFGRGGTANDRISAEGQDNTPGPACSFSGSQPCFNNANFSTGADGTLGRMQMYLWDGPTPHKDGTADAEIILHEVTHGTSVRLHGNGTGLSNQGQMMGEGWSDFYALAMLAEPTDSPTGVYSVAGYVMHLLGPSFTSNYYYGIRRFPTAVIASTGGPNNKPHNPLTFRYINNGCDALIGTTTSAVNSAFPRNSVISTSESQAACSQLHNGGEIWSAALWEVRALMIQRLGFTEGTRKVLQVVTDAMKIAPANPTMLHERDAIITAAAAYSAADAADVREGFRRRGMGFGASVQSVGSVTESFNFVNAMIVDPFSVSDSSGDNDGVLEPGETVTLSVAVRNTTGAAVNNVSVNVTGGGNANYGTVGDGQTLAQQITYTIPANAPCGSNHSVTLSLNSALGAQAPATRSFALGLAQTALTEKFDGVAAPALPATWTTTQVGAGALWTTTQNSPASSPNAAFTVAPASTGESSLISPSFNVPAAGTVLRFKLNHFTEFEFDGMALEIKIGNGSFQDILVAGGAFNANGYNGSLFTDSSCSSSPNPLSGRPVWTGNSGGYKSVEVVLPPAAAGQSVQVRFRHGSDCSIAETGVRVDDVEVVTGFSCSFTPPTSIKSRADFDADGRTDLSVYRPSEGNWYLYRSGEGFSTIGWGGQAGDTPVPGDFNGDGRSDLAIYRVSESRYYILSVNAQGGISFWTVNFGQAGDRPLSGDFDGDGKTDIAIFRPSENNWYILNAAGYFVSNFGAAGDIPVPGDYDGDGKTDIAVWRPSTGQWFIIGTSAGFYVTGWGVTGDRPVPADYDGDNKDDLAIYRPSDGNWWLFNSAGIRVVGWGGQPGDIPVPGDYDGDGKDDFGIYRGGTWFLFQSQAGFAQTNWGVPTDTAIPEKYVPFP